MSDEIVTQIPTSNEKQRELEVGWNNQSQELLLTCAKTIQQASSMRLTVKVPPNTNSAAVKRVISALATRGWIAEEESGSDQRDGSSWHNLKISPDNIPEHTR